MQLYAMRRAAKDNFYDILKELAGAGFVGVEFAGLYGKDPVEVRKLTDDLGMVAITGHTKLVNKDNLNESVDLAKTLGYDTIVSGYDPKAFATAAGIAKAAEDYEQAAALLKPCGLTMGYHNHWWEMGIIDGTTALETFLKLAPSIVSELDIYWAMNFMKNDATALIDRIASRIPLLHIKDGPCEWGKPNTAVGKGKVNVQACIDAADAERVKWLIVELDECATDMMEALKESLRYVIDKGWGMGK